VKQFLILNFFKTIILDNFKFLSILADHVEDRSILIQIVTIIKFPSDLLSGNVTLKIDNSHAHNMSNGNISCWNRESDKI
jgi:hypothetical protein